MMNHNDIHSTVITLIERVAQEQALSIHSVETHHAITDDLGFTSLDVATLAALLELEFDVDPFANNMAVITEIRTVQDIIGLYTKCLNFSTDSTEDDQAIEEVESSRIERRKQRRSRSS
ncbi:phosphopantetheine-binding protein [Cellvibrio sp. QJXJ]|uniref:phosphopantetheine-binding protein n=1 Tax=Cellvibrio sp. QJXJ TaxID=2964606 RepID=UPI0021C3140A|nr:phosphopantetheine-binding protein [Cellvibrio sp. QJXJ]UUA73394.1 phosphopantetheine-binding protein [Cellvibrio sp. QJXJ]